jgi:hypothetical protein
MTTCVDVGSRFTLLGGYPGLAAHLVKRYTLATEFLAL